MSSVKKPIVVLKVGTSTLMDPITQLPSVRNMGNLVETVVDLKNRGCDVVLVTSGAIGFGCKTLGLTKRPPTIPGKQAMAALGQSELMRVYRMMFDMLNQNCAQLLITRTDLVHKSRYLNFKNALLELLKFNVVPIINENDAVTTEELRFGDNDSLSAHVAVLCDAEWLFLLTDVDCLYTANPRTNPSAEAVAWVPKLEHLKVDTGGAAGGTAWGTGGMATKLVAAQIATAAGIHTVLANGQHPHRVFDILKREDATTKLFEGEPDDSLLSENGYLGFQNFNRLPWPGTVFKGAVARQTLKTRRRWVLSLPVKGRVLVDAGAAKAIKKGWSLLAVGVKGIRGKFLAEEAVVVVTPAESVSSSNHARSSSVRSLSTPAPSPCAIEPGHAHPEVETSPLQHGCEWDNVVEVAHCLISVSSAQLKTMKGKHSHELEKVLGYTVDPEVAHRQNIVLLGGVDDSEE